MLQKYNNIGNYSNNKKLFEKNSNSFFTIVLQIFKLFAKHLVH